MTMETEQELHDEYVKLCGGRGAADRLARLYARIYPCIGNKPKSKAQVFRECAVAEGFTHRQVNALLELQ